MRQIEPKVPSGMHLLPALPTLHEVLRVREDIEWIRFPSKFVRQLEIPIEQQDFLIWPGLPKQWDDLLLSPFWTSTVELCIESGQQRFGEFIQVFQQGDGYFCIERFTGYLWEFGGWGCEEVGPAFVASGLEEFFLLDSLWLFYEIYNEYDDEPGDELINYINDGSLVNHDDFLTLVDSVDFRSRQSHYFADFFY